MVHDGFYNDILTSFNVNEIKSVKVMANGTAIYGAKGANGVILIETKRNTSLATKIDATVSAGITLLPKSLPMMSGSQFKTYASDLLKTTGTNLSEFQFLTSDPNNYYYIINIITTRIGTMSSTVRLSRRIMALRVQGR